MTSKTTFGRRLVIALEARGMGTNELNRAMGKEMGFVSNLKKRAYPPTGETLAAIGRALRVRTDWLISGEGPMAEDEEPISSTRPMRLADAPGWTAAEKEARELYPYVPDYAWEGARELVARRAPARLSAEIVLSFANAWAAAAPEERRAS